MDGVLFGLRVLDFTRVLSGPYATMILADYGAEVIKVQSKKVPVVESNGREYLNAWNRNKRSITLDMSYPEARRLALKLVAISDVLIENFSPRVMANWGMDYHQIKKIKPDIIMMSMSGMGKTGPWNNYVAYGSTVHALGGLSFLTAFDPAAPLGPGHAVADHVAGLYGIFALLAALENRAECGQGQFIDLSQYEVVASMIGPALLGVLSNKYNPIPRGNQSDYQMAAPHGCYQCRGENRWCVIGVFNEAEWQALLRVMGNPVWASDDRFASLQARYTNSVILDNRINAWTRAHDAQEVVAALQAAEVPAGVVQNAEDLSKDPQLLARRFFVPIGDPILGHTVADRSPLSFRQSRAALQRPSEAWSSAPPLGEGNRYVYLNLLQLEESEYISYVEKGVIG